MHGFVDGRGRAEPVEVGCRVRLAPEGLEDRRADGARCLNQNLHRMGKLWAGSGRLWSTLLHRHQSRLLLWLQGVHHLRLRFLSFLCSRRTGQEGPIIEEPGNMLAVYRMVRDHVDAHAPGRLLQAVDARQAAELHQRQVQAHRHGLLQERAGQGFAQHCGTAAGNTQVADTGDEAHTRASPPHFCHSIDEVLRGSSDAMGT
mmetsp:Transcript_15662/g.37142  ORF Transcript_15662/g.37142 Transcript_15662/m.37142 type:complete len:202 (-) Transcript_15662:5176-5781(-)